MQQTLYLVRHAHASSAESDHDRPVSAKGERQLSRLCQVLKGKELVTPSAIWHSDLKRAIETAQQLVDGLALTAPMKTLEGLRPFDDPIATAEIIDRSTEDLMIVGHEPNLSSLAAQLITGMQTLECVVFQKASILCLRRMKVGAQATPWQIEWHLHHRLFKSRD